jgi:hypothetical protein
MNSYIQFISLFGSFIYGVCLFYFYNFNIKLISKYNIFLKIIISLLLLFDIALLYVCFLYKLNGGVLHIYNIVFLLLGNLFISVKKRKW